MVRLTLFGSAYLNQNPAYELLLTCPWHLGDYISYMDDDTKNSRRTRWKNFNFAGTIDWAVDLQAFSEEDKNHIDRPESGHGCRSGEDNTANTLDLCEFACRFGFCPETLCTCTERGNMYDLPTGTFDGEVEAWMVADIDLNRLCKFSCKYGYCPEEVCAPPVIDEEVDEDEMPVASDSGIPTRDSNSRGSCTLWKGLTENDIRVEECKSFCKE
jgi:hypothetical protein